MFWNRKISPENKCVLITGCDFTSGFGNRLAFRLNQKGFRVYATVLDPNSPGSLELIKTCQFKDKISVIQLDVTNDDMIDKCYDQIKTELENTGEQLWALVNNAGRTTYGHTEWGQMDVYIKTFDVNVFGVVRMTRKFLPLIRPNKGRIVITASGAGRISVDNFGPYCMSKHAIICYSDVLRREMKKFKVNVSTIEPGSFKTALYYTLESISEDTWNQTNEDIRQTYGEQYFAQHLKAIKIRKKLSSSTKNLDIVVNDMIDAVMSLSPQRSYMPCNSFIIKMSYKLMPIVPQFILDTFFSIMDRTVPDTMKNNPVNL